MLLQFLKGNALMFRPKKAINLQNKDAVFKIWDNLKRTSALDAKAQLKIMFHTSSLDINNS